MEVKFTQKVCIIHYSVHFLLNFRIPFQGVKVLDDFNIQDEAGGVGRAIAKNFTANITDNTLEIHFYWGGKGTTAIPYRGVYGPLISAISVTGSKSHSSCHFLLAIFSICRFLTYHLAPWVLLLVHNHMFSCTWKFSNLTSIQHAGNIMDSLLEC